MKLDKKQVPQVILLGLLVVGCVGYVSFTFMKPATPAPAPPASKAETKPNVSVQVQTQPVGAFPDLAAPLARRDPFVAQKIASAEADRPQPARRHSAPNAAVTRADFGKVPPLNLSNLLGHLPAGATPGSQTTMAVPSAQPAEAPVLTGVVRGAENVAIIRIGNSERHIVKEGQVIDGRYKVLSVSRDGAVLVDKDVKLHLKLGGV